jgi:hypothetical protein
VRLLEQVGERLELSVVPVPANARTATLALKDSRLESTTTPNDEQVVRAHTLGVRTPKEQRIHDDAREGMLRLFAQADAERHKELEDDDQAPPSHIDLELGLLREGYITRPVTARRAAGCAREPSQRPPSP